MFKAVSVLTVSIISSTEINHILLKNGGRPESGNENEDDENVEV